MMSRKEGEGGWIFSIDWVAIPKVGLKVLYCCVFTPNTPVVAVGILKLKALFELLLEALVEGNPNPVVDNVDADELLFKGNPKLVEGVELVDEGNPNVAVGCPVDVVLLATAVGNPKEGWLVFVENPKPVLLVGVLEVPNPLLTVGLDVVPNPNPDVGACWNEVGVTVEEPKLKPVVDDPNEGVGLLLPNIVYETSLIILKNKILRIF